MATRTRKLVSYVSGEAARHIWKGVSGIRREMSQSCHVGLADYGLHAEEVHVRRISLCVPFHNLKGSRRPTKKYLTDPSVHRPQYEKDGHCREVVKD